MCVCEVNENDFENTVIGGGVIPYCINPMTGKVSLLLAQERRVFNWRGSQKWSGFEGGRKEKEHFVRTAAREFHEESMALIPFSCHRLNEHTYTSEEEIESALHAGQYSFRIALRVIRNDNSYTEHLTFFVQVQYDECLCDRFAALRKELVDLNSMLDAYRLQAQVVHECGLPSDHHVYKHLDNLHVCKVLEVHHATLKASCNKSVDVECMLESGDHTLVHVEKTRDTHVEELHKLVSMHKAIDMYLRSTPHLKYHPALCYDANAQLVGVSRDFLEKQCIRFWTLDELHVVLNNGGHIQEHVFRAYFMPVLQAALEHRHLLESA